MFIGRHPFIFKMTNDFLLLKLSDLFFMIVDHIIILEHFDDFRKPYNAICRSYFRIFCYTSFWNEVLTENKNPDVQSTAAILCLIVVWLPQPAVKNIMKPITRIINGARLMESIYRFRCKLFL